VDAAVETAVASLLATNDKLNRVEALRLLTQRTLKKNVTNRVRPRSATS
jgi:hypothetical protein